MSPKVWFITGASSGLGRAVTEHVLSVGDIAVATCRKPPALADLSSKYPESQLLVLKVDVSKPQDVVDAFAEVRKRLGRIDVVYSNAGYGVLGEIEGTSDDAARPQFEANFWGAVSVAKEAVKFFREVNQPSGGRLLVATSIAGISAMPGIGQYSATKFASDGLHEALSKEVNPSWNIKFTIIVVGGFQTRSLAPESMVTVPPHPAYADAPTSRIRQYMASGGGVRVEASAGAKVLYKIANDPAAPLRVPLGMDAVKVVKARAGADAQGAEYGAQFAEDFKS